MRNVSFALNTLQHTEAMLWIYRMEESLRAERVIRRRHTHINTTIHTHSHILSLTIYVSIYVYIYIYVHTEWNEFCRAEHVIRPQKNAACARPSTLPN